MSSVDVVIVGGGPAGLSAALTLGRARRRVLLCDAGSRRNAAATAIHNFVTQDGTSPDDFRRVAHEQLAQYPNVTIRHDQVDAISGTIGAFTVTIGTDIVRARRILLCVGMVDTLLPIEGFQQFWGHSIVACPYCHGWEAKDLPWGYLVTPENHARILPFALQLRCWTDNVTVFTHGAALLPTDVQQQLADAGIRIEMSRIVRLRGTQQQLDAIELENGWHMPCAMLFTHPPQEHTPLVKQLALTNDTHGFLAVHPTHRTTSTLGMYAAGDAVTPMQSAVGAAATGMQAAAMINVDLATEQR